MSMHRFAAAAALGAGALVVACTPDSSEPAAEETVPEPPEISVTVPEERLTPFCEAMIDLSDQLRSGDVDDANALIIATYRAIRPDVPLEIAADFDIVLTALEAGLPPPTDPPIEPTVATTLPPTSAPGTGPGATQPVEVDEGFDPDTSPTERVNSYVDFACRSTGNNPGPPATQPGDVPADEEDDAAGDADLGR